MESLCYNKKRKEVNLVSKKGKKNRRKLELAATILLIILKVLELALEILKD